MERPVMLVKGQNLTRSLPQLHTSGPSNIPKFLLFWAMSSAQVRTHILYNLNVFLNSVEREMLCTDALGICPA